MAVTAGASGESESEVRAGIFSTAGWRAVLTFMRRLFSRQSLISCHIFCQDSLLLWIRNVRRFLKLWTLIWFGASRPAKSWTLFNRVRETRVTWDCKSVNSCCWRSRSTTLEMTIIMPPSDMKKISGGRTLYSIQIINLYHNSKTCYVSQDASAWLINILYPFAIQQQQKGTGV